MLRYCAAATALKAFSCSNPTKKLYRALGNTFGTKKRSVYQMPSYYFNRVNETLRLTREYTILKDGYRLLELGTGWLHWEAITSRLFFSIDGILCDVWDNRQIEGLKNYLSQLDKMLDKTTADNTQRVSAHRLISQILEVDKYQDIYELLGFEYVIDPEGILRLFEDESFDLVISRGVMEHVSAKDTSEFVSGIARVLKPGGYSVHSINIRDHLYQYDNAVSQKQYLQYSDWVWRAFFQNDVQYINRIQRSDWLALFKKVGLMLVEENVEEVDLSGVRVAKAYQQRYDKDDLRCGGLAIVHSKHR
jgi:predicted SAM-dependent methyltransferase